MSDNDNKLVRGLYYNEPRKGAPDYVLAGISLRPVDFIGWLEAQTADDKGYVKIDVLRAKSGKVYAKLNDWKPDQSRGQQGGRAADPTVGRVAEAFGGNVAEGADEVPF